jgi:hypothetical protein
MILSTGWSFVREEAGLKKLICDLIRQRNPENQELDQVVFFSRKNKQGTGEQTDQGLISPGNFLKPFPPRYS